MLLPAETSNGRDRTGESALPFFFFFFSHLCIPKKTLLFCFGLFLLEAVTLAYFSCSKWRLHRARTEEPTTLAPLGPDAFMRSSSDASAAVLWSGAPPRPPEKKATFFPLCFQEASEGSGTSRAPWSHPLPLVISHSPPQPPPFFFLHNPLFGIPLFFWLLPFPPRLQPWFFIPSFHPKFTSRWDSLDNRFAFSPAHNQPLQRSPIEGTFNKHAHMHAPARARHVHRVFELMLFIRAATIVLFIILNAHEGAGLHILKCIDPLMQQIDAAAVGCNSPPVMEAP